MLHRVLVDEKLLAAAQRCRKIWQSLQELGGIRTSPQAERLIARERKAWEEQKQREIEALKREASTVFPSAGAAPGAALPPAIAIAPATLATKPAGLEAAEPEKAAGEAYIANLEAGSYRELIEAAESCQVSIIHPGKPRNPNEPGLAELLKRAEPFL